MEAKREGAPVIDVDGSFLDVGVWLLQGED